MPVVTVTAALLAEFQSAALISTVVGGVIGNRADDWICKGTKHVYERIKGQEGKPINHDIQRAVRTAYLKATLLAVDHVARKYSWTSQITSNDPDDLREIKKYLLSEIRLLEKGDARFPKQELGDGYRKLLDRDTATGQATTQQLITALRKSMIDELARNRRLRVERAVNEHVYEGWNEGKRRIDWYELTCAFFSEAIKTDERLYRTIQTEYLTDLISTLPSSSFEVRQVTDRLDDYETQYPEIKELISTVIDNQEAIRETQVTHTQKLDEIKESFSKIVPRVSPHQLTASLPTRTPPLLGRDDLFRELNIRLDENQATILLRGMGGVGKTTLATALLWKRKEKLKHVAWVEQIGTDFSSALLADSVLLKNLGVVLEPTDNRKAKAREVLNAMANLPGPSLLVIDNAEADVDDYLSNLPTRPHWQVLITSRNQLQVNSHNAVPNLNEDAAVELFRRHYSRMAAAEEEIRTIVREVDYHTLTIEILAKTAHSVRITLVRLIEMLRDRGLGLGRRAAFRVPHSGQNEVKMVLSYLSATFTLLAPEPDVLFILKRFLFLPAGYHHFDLIKRLFEFSNMSELEQDNFNVALNQLVAQGWLDYSDDQGYKMHRVVREALHQQLQSSINYADLRPFIKTVRELISFDSDQGDHVELRPFIIYAQVLAECIEKKYLTEEVADFWIRLGLLMKAFGRPREAVPHEEAALAELLKLYGNQHRDVAVVRSNLGITYLELGEYEKGAESLQTALEADLLNYDHGDPIISIRKSHLGLAYQDLSRERRDANLLDDAAKLLREALDADIFHFGKEHPRVAKRRANLAGVYKDMGDYKKAARLLKAALKADLLYYDEPHPVIDRDRSNLGTVYNKLERFPEAITLINSALKSAIAQYGEQHTTVAGRMINLARVYENMNDKDAVLDLVRKSSQIFANTLGETHRHTIAARRWLDEIKQA